MSFQSRRTIFSEELKKNGVGEFGILRSRKAAECRSADSCAASVAKGWGRESKLRTSKREEYVGPSRKSSGERRCRPDRHTHSKELY